MKFLSGFGKGEEKSSGINTNENLSNSTIYEAIPFVLAMPKLTTKLYNTLAKDRSSSQPFFVWNVKPGDRVERNAIIAEFNLKSQHLLHKSVAQLRMPHDGIITETSKNEESPYLFAFQPLLPLTKAFHYRNKSPLNGEQKDSLEFLTFVRHAYLGITEKTFSAVNDKGLPDNDANDFVNDELEKMGQATIIPLIEN
ncbi:hypothetical protein SAMN05216420_10158 [Nitrosospira sp. Nl5]|uniref:hypothetical protein n=1 Tax=Nitrosospira sp. Nl5 TaxID=200120 RepID=UPI0008849706|nr:hypothetical protein [Nitrosospira sp. Nl5]SCX83832.1 hypothetical protein SAMN05216420_10158 [Nitrosospira sp. Nl5]